MTARKLLIKYAQGNRIFSKANLSRANLSRANLSRANLSWIDLSWVDLNGVDLNGVDLRKANFKGADLSWANLREANFKGADLNKANLSKANLSGANLSGAQGPFECAKGGSGYILIFVNCQDHVEIQSGCRHFNNLVNATKHWHHKMNRSQEHIDDVLEALTYLKQRCRRKGWLI